ncbi:MAG TPA: DUF1269 domain-containing protein [Thermomicrobiales bacterium]|nr:DUF1269 domain-containing protein [Thermomicrobiales bacterium]
MSQTPVQVVIAAFQDENTAKQALDQLDRAQRDRIIHIQNAAVLRRDHDGKLHVSETRDWSGKRGLAVGGLLGAAVGILAGPVGLAAGAGAAIGGLAARLRDSGFSDDRLRRIGDGLLPGTSALVAVIEHTWVDQAERMLAEAGADVVAEAVRTDIAHELEAGHEVVLTAVDTGDTLAAERLSMSDDRAEVTGTAVTADEATVYAAEVTSTTTGAGGATGQPTPSTPKTGDQAT